MSTSKPIFKPIFPIPFGYANFGEKIRHFNSDLIRDIEKERSVSKGKKRTFAKNSSGWQSEVGLENKYESFDQLAKIILITAKPILYSSGVSKKEKLTVNGVWANLIFAAGGFSNPHIHGSGTTIWTGVYYPKGITEEDNLDNFDETKHFGYGIPNVPGTLVCKDQNIAKRVVKFEKNNRAGYGYYGHVFSIIPRESLLVLFPAWLEHYVTPTVDNSKRYSISFAINVR